MQSQLETLKSGQVAVEKEVETHRGQQTSSDEAIEKLWQEMEVSAKANLNVHQVCTS